MHFVIGKKVALKLSLLKKQKNNIMATWISLWLWLPVTELEADNNRESVSAS